MKVKIVGQKTETKQSSLDMEIGQVAKIIEQGIYEEEFILRTYDGFVSLTNPRSTWVKSANWNVKILPSGTIIELTT